MKEIVVVSGKGGTGKTSFVASFAMLAKCELVLGDCDVDAANLALLIPGNDFKEEPFYAGQKAIIDEKLCTGCGMCAEVCRYEAITALDSYFTVRELACEGCKACSVVCPAGAIEFKDNRAGTLFERNTENGVLVHGALGIAQDNSGKLVAEIRKRTRGIAKEKKAVLSILDGPPGIGCPVHAAVGGVDLVVIVTEPSLSGQHDLERVLELCEHFKLPSVVVVNKYDLSVEITERIEYSLKQRQVKIVGKIPFDEGVPKALSRGYTPLVISNIKDALVQTWKNIENEIGIGAD